MGSDSVSALFYCFSKSPFCPETALAIMSRACRPVAGFQCWVPADRRHRRNGLPTVTAAGGNGELRHVLAPKRLSPLERFFRKRDGSGGISSYSLETSVLEQAGSYLNFFLLKLYRPAYIVFVSDEALLVAVCF